MAIDGKIKELTNIMYATKSFNREGKELCFSHIQSNIEMMKYYPKGKDGKIYKLEVSIHKDQTPETRTSGFTNDYWGWLKTDSNELLRVYPSYPQFSMCFAGGHKRNEELGMGKGYRLKVKEIECLDDFK